MSTHNNDICLHLPDTPSCLQLWPFLSKPRTSINILTVIRLEELSVFTQYLFHRDSKSFLSREDLKYDISSE